VGVVGADLEHARRQHQTRPRQAPHQRVATLGREVRGLAPLGIRDRLVPAGGYELAERLVAGPLRAGGAARGEVLHPLAAAAVRGRAVLGAAVLGAHPPMVSWRGLPWAYEGEDRRRRRTADRPARTRPVVTRDD